MSRFYGSMQGSRDTTVTKCGTKNTGMHAHIRGWNLGAMVSMSTDSEDNDIVTVTLTGGSNGTMQSKTLGSFKRVGDEFVPLVKVQS